MTPTAAMPNSSVVAFGNAVSPTNVLVSAAQSMADTFVARPGGSGVRKFAAQYQCMNRPIREPLPMSGRNTVASSTANVPPHTDAIAAVLRTSRPSRSRVARSARNATTPTSTKIAGVDDTIAITPTTDRRHHWFLPAFGCATASARSTTISVMSASTAYGFASAA